MKKEVICVRLQHYLAFTDISLPIYFSSVEVVVLVEFFSKLDAVRYHRPLLISLSLFI